MRLSPHFDAALVMAAQLHADQVRKVSGVPYISHLMSVCAIALEHGATENQAIAALLHDAAEDQGGQKTLDRIRQHFGDEVAAIVTDCTDNLSSGHMKWRERKEAYLRTVPNKLPASFLVIAADKFHNASSIVRDIEQRGLGFLDNFAGGPEGVAWYYGALSTEIERAYPSRIADLLAGKCKRLAELTGTS